VGGVHHECLGILKAIAAYVNVIKGEIQSLAAAASPPRRDYPRNMVLSAADLASVLQRVPPPAVLRCLGSPGPFTISERDLLRVDSGAILKACGKASATHGAASRVCDMLREYNPKCTVACPDRSSCVKRVHALVTKAMQGLDPRGLLEPLDRKDVRLFGERRSAIIEELEQFDAVEGRPMYRPFGIPFSDKVLAVPYNANIGLFVYNPGTLGALAKKLRESDKNLESLRQQTAAKLVLECCSLLADVGEESDQTRRRILQELPAVDECAKHRAGQMTDGQRPETWEEVLHLCRLFKELLSVEDKARYAPLWIETQTFDTYMATMLEVLWAFGGHLDVHADYSIADSNAAGEEVMAVKQLLWTMRVFERLFRSRLTPESSCLDPRHIHERRKWVNQSSGPTGATADATATGELPVAGKWLFARHWYSTLIESLTAREERGDGRPGPYLMEDDILSGGVKLMCVPLSLYEYTRQWMEYRKGVPSACLEEFEERHVQHHSCLGEWYLAVMSGSENVALGLDLINNLMSSQKIAERAARGAAVPTVEEFYEIYGRSRAVYVPERSNLCELPTETWNEFRGMFLKGAKSRTSVFDYRHCIRELHGVMELVRVGRPTDAELEAAIKKAKCRINDLAKQLVLGH
jgi:hypothetical protein